MGYLRIKIFTCVVVNFSAGRNRMQFLISGFKHVTDGFLLQAVRLVLLFPHSRGLNGFTSCKTAT